MTRPGVGSGWWANPPHSRGRAPPPPPGHPRTFEARTVAGRLIQSVEQSDSQSQPRRLEAPRARFLGFDLTVAGAGSGAGRSGSSAGRQRRWWPFPPCTPQGFGEQLLGASTWGFDFLQSERPGDRGPRTLRAPPPALEQSACPARPGAPRRLWPRGSPARSLLRGGLQSDRRAARGLKAGRPSWSGALCRPSAEERRRGPPHCGESKGCCLLCRHRERWVFSLPLGPGNSTFPGGSEIGVSSSSHFIGLVGPTPGVSQHHRGEPKDGGQVACWSRGMILA